MSVITRANYPVKLETSGSAGGGIVTKLHLTATLLLAFVASASAQEFADGKTAEQIRECSRANFPTETSVQTIELTSFDRSGGKRVLKSKLFWKRMADGYSRAMMQVSSPVDLSGSSYLILEKAELDDMYIYLPNVRKSRRIVGQTGSKPLWNTDFSYEDIKQLQGVTKSGTVKRLPDVETAGRKAHVLEVLPAVDQSSYEMIVAQIDQQTCTPLQLEFYESGRVLRKRLISDPASLVQQQGRWVMRSLEMRDLRDETRTTVQIDKIEYNEKLADTVFNPLRYYQFSGR